MLNYIEMFKLGTLLILSVVLFPITLIGYASDKINHKLKKRR
jgi:hypothetical protein